MAKRKSVWIDVECCSGCGACIESCPTGAITMSNSVVTLDEENCTGCGVCIDACPEGVIQRVIEGEIVTVQDRPAPTVHRPSPLAETAGTAIVATGVGLLAKAAGALVRAVGHWLTQPSTTDMSTQRRRDADVERTSARDRAGRGRQIRRRRRGR